METAVVGQLLDFFHDFLNICQLENWPNNNTNENELRNAFLMSQHVVKCLDKLQKQSVISEFVSTFSDTNISSVLLKTCLEDPPKYILKKIINSSTKISQMDIGFKLFVELFSENKLESCLSDFFVEAASKETLLKNIAKEFPKETVLMLKTELFLCELNECEDCKPIIKDMICKNSENTIEMLVICMLNKNIKYAFVVNNIVNIIKDIMLSKELRFRCFWNQLFRLEEKHIVGLCVEHNDIFHLLSKALLDCGRLIKEHMSAEYFYIDLTYSELKTFLQKICKTEQLKIEFLELVKENEYDLAFWNNILL